MCFTMNPRSLLAVGLVLAVRLDAQRPLPPIPAVHRELRLDVTYPKAGSVLDIADSTFLMGNVGDGSANLTVNGLAVPVAPNGAWLAWIAIPRDSATVVRLEARLGSRVVRSELPLRRAGWVSRVGAWVVPGSMQPRSQVWLPADEALTLRVRAAPGASVRLILPDGGSVPFAAAAVADPPPSSVLAFERDDRRLDRSTIATTYLARLDGATAAGVEDWLRPAIATSGPVLQLEVIVAADTTRLPWPLTVRRQGVRPTVVRLEEPTKLGAERDGIVIGRNLPGGAYHWFFPVGTVATAEARQDDLIRLRLASGATAWVPLAEVMPQRAMALPGLAVMGSLTLVATQSGARLRIPLSVPVAHQVRATPAGLTITLFGVAGDADWTRYPVTGRFVRWLGWHQIATDRVELELSFAQPLWGWRVRVDRGDLVFEFRQPPVVDRLNPFKGRRIVLDPGHPPLGACGPTGLCEPEATLAVARIAADRLRALGADVTLTRRDARPVELWQRVAIADSLNAEVLVSIHLNALPDGINPFTNNGSSTFFQHPQSIALAQAIQDELVRRLGLRNLGVARGDLALVRPTWYPAVLAEGLFLMIPAQESAMRSAEGQQRYADAIVGGLRTFLGSATVSTIPPARRPQAVASPDRPE
jgi:N-acetylmuramoyl-L-alanine amidase